MRPADEPQPSPAEILRCIAASGSAPWFPLTYAAATGVPRDDLDAPLSELRLAELILASDWQKGLGQGYALTPGGLLAAADPAVLGRALAGQPPDPGSLSTSSLIPTAARVRRPSGETAYARGEWARRGVYDPPPPLVTPLLIALNVVVFLIGLGIAWQTGVGRVVYLKGQDLPILMKMGAVSGADLVHGEWWRLGSCCFVHVGLIHLLMNVYFLGIFGPLAEGLWGRWRFAVIYAIAGIGGSCLAMAIHPVSLLAGASGAIWGIMTSVAAWLLLYHQHLPTQKVREWTRMLIKVLVLNGLMSLIPHVSWQAHLGGGLVGFAAAFGVNVVRRAGWWRLPLGGLILGGLLVACVAGLMAYAAAAEPWRPLIAVESLRARHAYFLAAQPALETIDPAKVQTVYAAAIHKARFALKTKETLEKVEHLGAEARGAGEKLASLPRGRLAAELHAQARDYVAAILELTSRLTALLKGTSDDIAAAEAARTAVDDSWRKFTGH